MDRNSIGHKKLETELVSSNVTQHTIFASGDGSHIVQKWQWHREIGMGRRGLVWQEVEPTFTLNRACKKINKAVFTRWPEVVNTNIRLSRSRRHDLFVDFQGWFEHDGSIYLAVEYFENGNMQKCLQDPIPEDEVKPTIRQLLEALQTMHEQDLVHHDLSLRSIYIVTHTPHWKVKIGNWGFARLLREEMKTDLYDSSEDISFLPPEKLFMTQMPQGEDILEMDKAVDMWSLGTVIFQLLTCRRLFPDIISMRRYCAGEEQLPVKILQDAGVSPDGIDLIHSLLKVVPKERISADTALKHSWLRPRKSTIVTLSTKDSVAPLSSKPKEADFIPEDWSTDQDYIDNITTCSDKEVRFMILGSWNDIFLKGAAMRRTTRLDTVDQDIRQHVSSLKSLTKRDGTNYPETHLKLILLALAAIENNETMVRTLTMKDKHGIKASDSLYGLTPLHLAAWMGSLNVVKLLVNERGVNTNEVSGETEIVVEKEQKSRFGKFKKETKTQYMSPLSPKSRDPNLVKVHYSQITLISKFGQSYTALHYAATRGRTLVLKYLVEHGARVNALTNANMTPLMLAICNHQQHAARLLIAKRADLNITTMWGRSAIRLAVENGLTGVLQLLMDAGAKHSPQKLLINAIGHGYTDVVSILVRAGGDDLINPLAQNDSDGTRVSKEEQTPLYAAAAAGFISIVKFLLQHGAKPDLPCANGDLPLLIAVKNRHKKIAELLLKNGSDLEQVQSTPLKQSTRPVASRSTTPMSALSLAVRNKDSELVNTLLEKGANANGNPSEVESPLVLAVRAGDIDIIDTLLKVGGADIDLKEKSQPHQRTVVQEAADQGDREILRLLEKHRNNTTDDDSSDHSNKSTTSNNNRGGNSNSSSVTEHNVSESIESNSSTDITSKGISTRQDAPSALPIHEKGKVEEKESNSEPPIARVSGETPPLMRNGGHEKEAPYWLWDQSSPHHQQDSSANGYFQSTRRGAVGTPQ